MTGWELGSAVKGAVLGARWCLAGSRPAYIEVYIVAPASESRGKDPPYALMVAT